MLSVLNFNSANTSWDNSGVLISYSPRQLPRLERRIGGLALLYEPTHKRRARGYVAAGIVASMKTDEDGRVEVHIRPDGLFIFPSPVRFRVRGKLVEAGLNVGGRAGIQIRDISREDFLRIVALGFGGVEKAPYALMREIDDQDPRMWAAEK